VNRIGDYALIGDCQSAALVGRDGSIDWACFPRFDSPAVFCAMLDAERGGAFVLRPSGLRGTRRAYLQDTNVLQTTFECERGTVELTDCMPVRPLDPRRPTQVSAWRSILRRVRCTGGEAEVRLDLWPRFEYGRFVPRFRLVSDWAAEIVGGADALLVRASRALDAEEGRVTARWAMREGEEVYVESSWVRSHFAPGVPTDVLQDRADMASRLDRTISFWRTWMAGCWYEGEWQDMVRRSALVLKALTFSPSGAVVAAPTTSLPEQIGGERNWDYRYTWIRDATLTLISLFILGFTDEADAFKYWLERTGAGRPEDLQIMYGIQGDRFLPEIELEHLAGHRGSRPVRIGNAAVKQLQLDCYGQLLEAAWLYTRAGRSLTSDNWRFIASLADIVCERWRQPDQGIWEIRDEPRHFIHSKLNCWVALDRAVRIAEARGGPTPNAEGWARERDAVAAWLGQEGSGIGWFPQAGGFDVADASALLVPAAGFLPCNDPKVLKTVEVVQRGLATDGLLHRYLTPDGVKGGEGAFVLCSFWLLDCLTHTGRLDEAERLMERLIGAANDVGLLAEEIDPHTGEALGNFPQAFSHMALVLSAAHLSAAKQGLVPDGACDYSELALDRLIAGIARRDHPDDEARLEGDAGLVDLGTIGEEL
jgi:GH15 family glucan-1,4-alpha-glucosidase